MESETKVTVKLTPEAHKLLKEATDKHGYRTFSVYLTRTLPIIEDDNETTNNQ